MADHKSKLIGYKLPSDVTDSINYQGMTKDKYIILDDIAKEFFQKAFLEDKKVEYANEFITLVTTDERTSTGKRGLKAHKQLKTVLEQVKNMEKRLK